ncbi:MAG: class I SAM-dependent methyltransferase [Bryobacteraceae bacterium]|jgi:predicted O-methyltransferase YrrM
MKLSKASILKALFDRYCTWRLEDLLYPAYPVVLDNPIRPTPRYGEGKPAHPEIAALLGRGDARYRQTVAEISIFSDTVARIPEASGGPGECYWENAFFSAMDAAALYSILGWKKPARYLEVGSGNSTMFARRAVRDLHLETRIVSVDPAPTAEVDALCDQVIRKPIEDAAPDTFDELRGGDMLFIDNSHRVFQNGDVTVFFLEILPRLKPGVLVYIHDIFLPFDYPTVWAHRHYSEQYLLAAYLLGGYARLEMLLPLAYLSQRESDLNLVNQSWPQPILQRSFSRYREQTGGYTGTSFWLEMK